MIAVELGRWAIPARMRPTFDEMEKFCRAQSPATVPGKVA